MGKDYKIDIKAISLLITRHNLCDNIKDTIYTIWPRAPIPYTYKRIVPITHMEVTTDMMRLNTPPVYGQRPSLLFCCFMDSRAARGDAKFNPWKLEHMTCTESYVSFDGKRYPDKSVESKFPSTVGDRYYDATESYANFLKAVGVYNNNTGNGYSIEDYVGGGTVFSYVLSEADLISDVTTPAPDKGFTSVSFQFEKAPDNNCELWVFGVYNSKIYLTRDGVVMADHVAGTSS